MAERPPFAKVDPEFVGLVMAHHARRLMARNIIVSYGTNMGMPPGFGIRGTGDLQELYDELTWVEEALETSEDLYEVIEYKRLQAMAMINRVKSEDLPPEEAEDLVKQAVIMQREIEGLVTIMEDMAGA